MQSFRHRESEDEPLSAGAKCCFGFLFFFSQILLHGVIALILYWVVQFRWKDGEGLPFSWRGGGQLDLEKQWNLHPVLMLTGLIYCMGQGKLRFNIKFLCITQLILAMLVYRACRCCRRIHNKLLHTLLHILAIPCVVFGFLAAWDYHSLRRDKQDNPNPLPHFYSIHSWLGLLTMGLFVLQFLVGVFSFLLLLCCESFTARYRAALVPVHSCVGTATFISATATALVGLTQKTLLQLK